MAHQPEFASKRSGKISLIKFQKIPCSEGTVAVSWPASPPPKPSPIGGEGFCAALDEDHARLREIAPIASIVREPSPLMGEGWVGVMSHAPKSRQDGKERV